MRRIRGVGKRKGKKKGETNTTNKRLETKKRRIELLSEKKARGEEEKKDSARRSMYRETCSSSLLH